MRLSFALLLLGLSVTSSGCALVEDAQRNLCVAIKTPIENHREMKRNRQWAESAWMRVRTPYGCVGYSSDYASGFKEGYAEYLFRGGDGEPPTMAPLRYRHLRYQTPQGYQSIQDWFHGYRHGAAIARDSGARQWIVGPTPLQMGHDTVAHHVPPLAKVVAPGIVPHMAPKMMPTGPREDRFEVIPLPQPWIVPPVNDEPGVEPIKNGSNVGLGAPPQYLPTLPVQARFGVPRGDVPETAPEISIPNWTSPPLRIRVTLPAEGGVSAPVILPQAPSLEAAKNRLRPLQTPMPVIAPVEPKRLPDLKVQPEFNPLPEFKPLPESRPLPEFGPLPEFKPLPEARAPETKPKAIAAPPVAPLAPPPPPPMPVELEIIQHGERRNETPKTPTKPNIINGAGQPTIIQSGASRPSEPAEAPQVLIWGTPVERGGPPSMPIGPPPLGRPLNR